jgi:RNA polymerase sigma-70 factor (ECF subfamily)
MFSPQFGLDDIEQCVLLNVVRSFPSYRGEGSLHAWVDSITVRVGLRYVRRVRARAQRESDLFDEVELASEPNAPFDACFARRRVQRLLSYLPPEQGGAVFLHYIMGLKVAEVAVYQGVPTETARSRIRLGMCTLRRRARKRKQIAARRTPNASM